MDPSFEILAEVIKILRADAKVNSFVNGRVYDRVPQKQGVDENVISPYISVETQPMSGDDFECIDAVNITIQINCWSWGFGEAYSSTEVRKLSFAARQAIKKATIEIATNNLIDFRYIMTRYLRANDGITNQAAILFDFAVDILDEPFS